MPTPQWNRLLEACKSGNLEDIKRELPIDTYYTLHCICEALEHGHEHIAEHLLQSDPPVDIGKLFKWGCSDDQLHVARYLFQTRKEHCDLSLPLNAAIFWLQFDTVRWLCENGASKESIDATQAAHSFNCRRTRMRMFEYGVPVSWHPGIDNTRLTHDEFVYLWHLKENGIRPGIDFSGVGEYLARFLKRRQRAAQKLLAHTTLAEDCVHLVFKYV